MLPRYAFLLLISFSLNCIGILKIICMQHTIPFFYDSKSNKPNDSRLVQTPHNRKWTIERAANRDRHRRWENKMELKEKWIIIIEQWHAIFHRVTIPKFANVHRMKCSPSKQIHCWDSAMIKMNDFRISGGHTNSNCKSCAECYRCDPQLTLQNGKRNTASKIHKLAPLWKPKPPLHRPQSNPRNEVKSRNQVSVKQLKNVGWFVYLMYSMHCHPQYHGIWWKENEDRYTIQISNRVKNAKLRKSTK